jgi:hypothetical protein
LFNYWVCVQGKDCCVCCDAELDEQGEQHGVYYLVGDAEYNIRRGPLLQHGLDHQLVLSFLLKVLDHTQLLQGLLLKVLVLVDRELLLCLLLQLGIDENFLFFLVWRN